MSFIARSTRSATSFFARSRKCRGRRTACSGRANGRRSGVGRRRASMPRRDISTTCRPRRCEWRARRQQRWPATRGLERTRCAPTRPRAPRPEPPLSPREQRRPSDRPGAVQGAKRRSEPLTARTDPKSSRARGKGGDCRRDWTNGLLALVNQAARHFRNIFAAAILALRP